MVHRISYSLALTVLPAFTFLFDRGIIGIKQNVNINKFFCGRTDMLWLRQPSLQKSIVPVWTVNY